MNEHYPFQNVPLPYAYDDLEPYIDTETMKLHHDRHLQTYIDNLNKALRQYPQFQSWALEDLLMNIPSLPEAVRTDVRNQGGGVYSHFLYFSNLAPADSTSPSAMFQEAVIGRFGNMETFQKLMQEAAMSYLVRATPGSC